MTTASENNNVKVYFFTEMPYNAVSLEEIHAFPSARITFPNSHFSPRTAQRLLNEYFDQYIWADECGFDGLMVNEHHNTPTCMDVQINISAGILARSTSNARILMLGNMLPVWDNPARLAEEIALVDVLSGGRVISGIVRGIGPESWATNTNPVYNRERFEEAHDLLIKCWTEPGPFRWEGKHYHFRALNPWMLPVQKPHPPIWTPGTGSPETVEWAARRRYTYAAFLTPLHVAERLFNLYRQYASEDDWVPGPDNFAFMIGCIVADTDAEAQEIGKSAMWRFRAGSGGPKEYWAPAGYLPLQPLESIASGPRAGGRPASLSALSYEELQSNVHLIIGSPDTVAEQLRAVVDRLGVGHLLLEAQLGTLSHEATMRSIKLLGDEVLPRFVAEEALWRETPVTRFAWALPPMGEGRPGGDDLVLRRTRARAPGRDGEEKLDVVIRQIEIGGLASHVIEPRGASETIVHLHGGGYRSGSSSGWCPFGARLATATSTRVILPDYPLAPEAPFPAALHALTGLYEQLVAEETPVVLSGDSAGGGLAAAFTASCIAAGAPVPAGLVLISPWLDLTVSAGSYVTRQYTDELFSAVSASDGVELYLQGRYPATDPLASPLFADPTSFPPVLLFAGGDEVLLDDAINYVAHLGRNGISVSGQLVAGMQHEWLVQKPDLVESEYAMADITQFIDRVFAAERGGRGTTAG